MNVGEHTAFGQPNELLNFNGKLLSPYHHVIGFAGAPQAIILLNAVERLERSLVYFGDDTSMVQHISNAIEWAESMMWWHSAHLPL